MSSPAGDTENTVRDEAIARRVTMLVYTLLGAAIASLVVALAVTVIAGNEDSIPVVAVTGPVTVGSVVYLVTASWVRFITRSTARRREEQTMKRVADTLRTAFYAGCVLVAFDSVTILAMKGLTFATVVGVLLGMAILGQGVYWVRVAHNKARRLYDLS